MKRVPALPNVPTLAESGLPQFDIYHWIGLFGPAKLPRDIVARLNAEVGRALAHPTVKERLTNQGLELMPTTPEQLGQQVRDGMQRWGQLIADARIELR
jgi:tripartite-type tricarboxylate transporter receptor subunit TctC